MNKTGSSRGTGCQTACKPGSVPARIGRGMAIPLGRSSPNASRDRPGWRTRKLARRPARHGTPWDGVPPLYGLAPGGVCRAAPVARGAVRAYRTLSPLRRGPARFARDGRRGLLSVALSLGSPPPGVTRHRASVEPGLSSRRVRPCAGGTRRAAIRPSGTRHAVRRARPRLQAGGGRRAAGRPCSNRGRRSPPRGESAAGTP